MQVHLTNGQDHEQTRMAENMYQVWKWECLNLSERKRSLMSEEMFIIEAIKWDLTLQWYNLQLKQWQSWQTSTYFWIEHQDQESQKKTKIPLYMLHQDNRQKREQRVCLFQEKYF